MKPLGWALVICVAGCAAPAKREAPAEPAKREAPGEPPKRGAYYKDDGPGESPPPNLAAIPDAEPKAEPLHRFANRPYQVFGKDYVPMDAIRPFRQRGVASWYGKRFHGGATSSGERYDMYAMSAAHPTLPVPSYARVTNVSTGRSVVVRINDRFPSHKGRVIDLSRGAARQIGLIGPGTGVVRMEVVGS